MIFLVTRTRGSRWDDSRPLEEQHQWQEHADFMDALTSGGFIAAGGPIGGTRDVLLIVRAGSEDEITARLAEDPWSGSGLLRTTAIRPWTLRLGRI